MEPPGSTRTVIHNLQPGTTYEFQVIGKNVLGDGMFSNIVKESTKGKRSVTSSSPFLYPASGTYHKWSSNSSLFWWTWKDVLFEWPKMKRWPSESELSLTRELFFKHSKPSSELSWETDRLTLNCKSARDRIQSVRIRDTVNPPPQHYLVPNSNWNPFSLATVLKAILWKKKDSVENNVSARPADIMGRGIDHSGAEFGSPFAAEQKRRTDTRMTSELALRRMRTPSRVSVS